MNGTNLPAVVQKAITENRVDLNKVNLMLPTQTFGEVLGMYDRVTIEVVIIDPSKDAGEVFNIGGKKSLGRIPLEKIASAVGIIWDPVTTTVIESSPTKSRAKATGALRKPNGEFIVLSEEKTVDLEAIEAEQRLKTEDEAKLGKIVEVNGKIVWNHTEDGKAFPKREPFKNEQDRADWIEREIRKAMISYRKFKDERAMTGAKERCVRALLALKSSYSDEELKKPFAFPRVLPDVNKMLADPAIRQAAIERMTGAAATIFGPGNMRQERPVLTIREAVSDAGLEISAEEVSEPAPESVDDDPFDEKEQAEAAMDPREKARLALEEWLRSDMLKASAKDLIRALLDNKEATLEALQNMLDRCAAYEERQKAKTAGGAQ
jgi:hypothetical protein